MGRRCPAQPRTWRSRSTGAEQRALVWRRGLFHPRRHVVCGNIPDRSGSPVRNVIQLDVIGLALVAVKALLIGAIRAVGGIVVNRVYNARRKKRASIGYYRVGVHCRPPPLFLRPVMPPSRTTSTVLAQFGSAMSGPDRKADENGAGRRHTGGGASETRS